MSTEHCNPIDRTNDETRLDEFIIDLVNGQMSFDRWQDVMPLLTRNPEYHLVGMIDAALEGRDG